MQIKLKPALYLSLSLILLLSSLCLEMLLVFKTESILKWLRLWGVGLLCLLIPESGFSFVYGEHKRIGDLAFFRAIDKLKSEGSSKLLLDYLHQVIRLDKDNYSFPALSGGTYPVTYGMLNGLSGDHQENPIVLEEQLKDPQSKLQKIIALHQSYLDKGMKAAPDAELVGLDLHYALAAAVNLSHFYAYGKTFQEQLHDFDLSQLKKARDRAYLSDLVKKLSRSNAIRMYVSMHLLAIDLAEQSAKMTVGQNKEGVALLQSALFLNGFADHFLEDAFSAGHLVVNRTMLESFTNNKALHDFYSEHGTVVMNRKAEIWRAYGDGKFEEQTTAGQRIILAVEASLEDLFVAFNQAAKKEDEVKFFDRIPLDKSRQAIYLLDHISCLNLVPIPYNSKLESLMPKETTLTADMRKANQLLYYRNFIRSRVGNSFMVARLNSAAGDPYAGFEFRVNALNFSKRYKYNEQGGKKGMVDDWFGYTLAYNFLRSRAEAPHQNTYQISGGLRANLDYWFAEKRFLGMYSYMETGLRFEKGKAEPVFAPSIGIHLGSLFNVNYYNMPGWLRLPAMYLLPLKIRYAPVFSFKHAPRHFAAAELDLFF
ncbi:hypothetical protein [Pedobacter nutrimenti]|uniref:Uncharacterized protein n=1 Tax=Pedobacter nutrimenti TaxID=1241337 RepID=A0A318U9L6_9SPHI|nr:hypothetical protein [Pedobacter nutrimenti]PYF71606.1 hypothetical protein B0O44_107221 [Pedobacter nutrimenti]